MADETSGSPGYTVTISTTREFRRKKREKITLSYAEIRDSLRPHLQAQKDLREEWFQMRGSQISLVALVVSFVSSLAADSAPFGFSLEVWRVVYFIGIGICVFFLGKAYHKQKNSESLLSVEDLMDVIIESLEDVGETFVESTQQGSYTRGSGLPPTWES